MTPNDDGTLSRRAVLKAGVGLGAAGALASSAVGAFGAVAGADTPYQSIYDIDHVVICMQENRSFDHYLGTLSGVAGFDDPNALIRPDGTSVFWQPDPDIAQNLAHQDHILPWHFNTRSTSAQTCQDLSNQWIEQHLCWNGGLMDGFVITHRLVDDAILGPIDGEFASNFGPLTMGYFTREDIPFQYALADAFTVGDHYFCSVLSETWPNRTMHMSGTIDPEGTMGGPVLQNNTANGQLRWEAYPERLQAAGIDWYLYQESDNFGDNMLPHFAAFQDPTTDLYRRGCTAIATPKGQEAGQALIDKLRHDVVSGNLPQVSWIVGSGRNSEHPSAPPAYGANFVSGIISALSADLKVWAKTALIINYDENDGYFDHVVPPTPPPGTPGEYLSAEANLANISPLNSSGDPGPVGLSFRVPLWVVSPFSRGGLVCSETFDHTSVLRFLERRFGVEVPYISAWRRETCGDLTGCFDFASPKDLTIPKLPDTNLLSLQVAYHQQHLPAPLMPTTQSMPSQEPGPPRRVPSGPV